MLNTQQIWVTQHRKIKLLMIRKLHLYWIAVTALASATMLHWEKDSHHSYPAMNTTSYNNNFSDMTCPLVQRWHQCYGSIQPSFDWIERALHDMEPILDIVNEEKTLWLYQSGILGPNLLIFILLNGHSNEMTLNDLLLYSLMSALLKPN